MNPKTLTRTFYPQWHKNFKPFNPELQKKLKIFQKEELIRKKRDLDDLKKKRLAEYSFIDDKYYYFTWNDFQNYLTNKDFNIEKCYIPNIIKREKREEEERRQREEEERRQIEYLENYDDNDYLNYFYEEEAFILSDTENNYNSNQMTDDDECNYSSDENLY